jgi:hypothetical protein
MSKKITVHEYDEEGQPVIIELTVSDAQIKMLREIAEKGMLRITSSRDEKVAFALNRRGLIKVVDDERPYFLNYPESAAVGYDVSYELTLSPAGQRFLDKLGVERCD